MSNLLDETQVQHLDDPKTGFKYAYKYIEQPGTKGKPVLLLLIHFRASIDFWEPKLIDLLAAERPLLLLEYVGVGYGAGGGRVADSIYDCAEDIAAFLDLFTTDPVDVLGFSIGGMFAQLFALNHPDKVRKLILAGTGLSAGEGVVQSTNDVASHAALPLPALENLLTLFFFKHVEWSRKAGEKWFAGNPTTKANLWLSFQYADGAAGMKAQLAANQKFMDPEQSKGKYGSYDRLGELTKPVFVAQGQDDYMIPTSNSFLLAQKLPNAHLHIYPDAGHAFLYQWNDLFSKHVHEFLDLPAREGEGGNRGNKNENHAVVAAN